MDAELRKRRWGFVLLTARVYDALLAGLKPCDVALLAKELVAQRPVRLRTWRLLITLLCYTRTVVHVPNARGSALHCSKQSLGIDWP